MFMPRFIYAWNFVYEWFERLTPEHEGRKFEYPVDLH